MEIIGSIDPEVMGKYATFHFGLHCLVIWQLEYWV